MVSLHRGPSIVSSCENPRHSTNALAPFSRAPLVASTSEESSTVAAVYLLSISTLFNVFAQSMDYYLGIVLVPIYIRAEGGALNVLGLSYQTHLYICTRYILNRVKR